MARRRRAKQKEQERKRPTSEQWTPAHAHLSTLVTRPTPAPRPDITFDRCAVDLGTVSTRIHSEQFTGAGLQPASGFPSLYKYSDPELAERMAQFGAVRVGTLEYYRAWDDRERGDREEGTLTFSGGGGVNIGPSMDPLTRAAALGLTGLDGDALRRVAVLNSSIVAHETHTDCWVYCTAHELSRGATGGKLASVEILNPDEFFRLVGLALEEEVGQTLETHAYGVVYRERMARGQEFGQLPSAFVKPNRLLK